MTTLNDIRRLFEGALKHTDNPAIKRLPEKERTVDGVAVAYLPRVVFAFIGDDGAFTHTPSGVCMSPSPRVLRREVDLTDPGTTHAFLVGFALYLGLDPGEGGLGVSWRPDGPGWRLEGVSATLTQRACVWFEARDREQLDDMTDPGGGDGPLNAGHTLFLHTPGVAAETDARKALALAVKHVLGDTP